MLIAILTCYIVTLRSYLTTVQVRMLYYTSASSSISVNAVDSQTFTWSLGDILSFFSNVGFIFVCWDRLLLLSMSCFIGLFTKNLETASCPLERWIFISAAHFLMTERKL